jgi:hypothetical protein
MLAGIVVLMQFNNCSPIADRSAFDNSYLLATCDAPGVTNTAADINNVNCAVPDANNLQIDPVDVPPLTANQADFNVAGNCNGGGFPNNVIYWTLKDSKGIARRNSGMIFNNQSWNGQCVKGKFTLYIELIAISEDNNNRTGLLDPTTGTRNSYTLDLSIVGFDSQGNGHPNNVFGARTLTLTPTN